MLARSLFRLDWVRPAAAVAAAGVSLIVLLVLWLQPDNHIRIIQDILLAGICWVAFAWAKTQPRRAALLAIGALGLDITWVIFHAGAINPTVSLLYPLLVVTVGVLCGTRKMFVAGAVAALALWLGPWLGQVVQGLPRFTADQMVGMVLMEIELIAAVYFGYIVITAFNAILIETEAARRRYHQLFEHAPDGLVELDEAGRVVESNPAALELLDLTAAKATGRLMNEVLQNLGSTTSLSLDQLSSGLPRVFQFGTGPRPQFIEITAQTQPGEKSHSLLVMRDTTALRLLDAQQEQSKRLESVGQLAAGIAHEFNNLLTAIGGNAGLLTIHADRDVQRFATQIMQAQQRAATLTRHMLAFARHDFHQPETLSLNLEIMEWRDLLQDIVGDRGQLTIKADVPCWVKVDQGHVEQILVNLVKNARDASAAGGRVDLRLNKISRIEAQKLGSPLEAGRQVMLEVADHGHGMSAEVKGRLYDPFFTTKPPGQGTGLGLSAVHGLVTQNGGAIFFESEVDHGTTARIFFPEVSGSTQNHTLEAKPGSPHAGRMILIVDDDLTACRTAVFALEGAGYLVTVVDSGFKAVKFFRQTTEEIHLVIASVILPVLAGRELGERLRKLQPGVPLLYVCGSFDLPAGWSTEDPAHPLLLKPFRAEELVKQVAMLEKRKR